MNEQRPSKELPETLPASSYDGDLWVRASDVLLVLKDRAELRTALRGIQSCSTCEACRGAATLALGGAQPAKQSDIRELTKSAYKDGYGEDLTDDRDLSARTHELMRQLSRPAHERESPHCSTCSCPPYEEPLAAEIRAATSRGAHSTEDAGRPRPSPEPESAQ